MAKKYRAIAEHLSCDLNGEAVILSMKNGKYYGLNTVGSSIWSLIQKPASFDDIKSAVIDEYEIDVTTCGNEVRVFLEKMSQLELLEIIDEIDE